MTAWRLVNTRWNRVDTLRRVSVAFFTAGQKVDSFLDEPHLQATGLTSCIHE